MDDGMMDDDGDLFIYYGGELPIFVNGFLTSFYVLCLPGLSCVGNILESHYNSKCFVINMIPMSQFGPHKVL